MGWQWHQLDHMQITCTSLQTYNHTSTLSLNFLRPDDLLGAQPTVSKHWRHFKDHNYLYEIQTLSQDSQQQVLKTSEMYHQYCNDKQLTDWHHQLILDSQPKTSASRNRSSAKMLFSRLQLTIQGIFKYFQRPQIFSSASNSHEI